MSVPQHIGDLIFPSHTGQREIWTLLPSSIVSVSLTSGWSHFAHVACTDIPHLAQEYVAIIFSPVWSCRNIPSKSTELDNLDWFRHLVCYWQWKLKLRTMSSSEDWENTMDAIHSANCSFLRDNINCWSCSDLSQLSFVTIKYYRIK